MVRVGQDERRGWRTREEIGLGEIIQSAAGKWKKGCGCGSQPARIIHVILNRSLVGLSAKIYDVETAHQFPVYCEKTLHIHSLMLVKYVIILRAGMNK